MSLPTMSGVGRLSHPAEVASRASFWAKVNLLGDCWVWSGARNAFGHGHVGYGGKFFSVHRCVYEYTYGRIPKGALVCHHCDNPPCVNPAHLYAGTAKDNTADMYERGRAPRIGPTGSANSKTALTEESVIEIRTAFAAGDTTPPQLAARFGISPGAINAILRGRSWRHAGGPICLIDRRGRHGNHARGPKPDTNTKENH